MQKKMMAVVKADAAPGLTLRDMPVPSPGAGEVLIRVAAASICGTDLHIRDWDPWASGRVRPPMIVGHEFCGHIVAIGPEVYNLSEGDLVSAESHIVCGRCDLCRTARGHICPNTQIIGVDRDGCFAEYIVMPSQNVWVNPPTMPVELAVLLENFGNAVHTVFAVNVTARKVLVTGCGPVGLMSLAVARAAGARALYATDISPYRLSMAKRMGADEVFNAAEDDVIEQVRAATEGEGVDVLLEMSGAPAAIEQGFTLLKDGGEAALLGLPAQPMRFDLSQHIIFKGATVKGIIGRRLWESWFEMRGLLRSGAVDLSPLVTHHFPLEEYDQALATMAGGESGKVVMYPPGADHPVSTIKASAASETETAVSEVVS